MRPTNGVPDSPEKVEFAWRTVVGPAMARATRVQLAESGTLLVRADDANWRREVEGAFPVILPRLRALLGEAVVRRLRFGP